MSDRYDDDAPCDDCRAIRNLRVIALRCGGSLGWEPAEVASFASELTGRPWLELGTDDLLRVIEEYWQLGLAIALRRARRRAGRRPGGRRARGA